jgi:hypothetical protein
MDFDLDISRTAFERNDVGRFRHRLSQAPDATAQATAEANNESEPKAPHGQMRARFESQSFVSKR